MYYEDLVQGKDPQPRAVEEIVWFTRKKLHNHLNAVQVWWADMLDAQRLLEWEEDAHSKRRQCTFFTE